MEISDTVELMNSPHYQDRFKAEYWQTKVRYERLKKTNTRLEAQALTGPSPYAEPKLDGTPAGVLRDQQRFMGEYLHILELRAEIENIQL